MWFAELFRFPWDKSWGYVTNGGTESNLYGLYLARELYLNGIVYYSQDAHYSIPKSVRLLRMEHVVVRSQLNGEIDYEDLRKKIKKHSDVPPIIIANIGTTMKEAVDRVDRVRGIFADLSISSSYIHADAALSGMTLPFIDGSPPFDFTAGIDSISVSGHKFIGSPIPCGIVIAKRRNVERVANHVKYIGENQDTTLSGSRNGVTPLFLWYAIRKYGKEGFRSMVTQCIGRAEYAVTTLTKAGYKAWRNPYAITIVIPTPPKSIVRKWQIAVHDDAHIIIRSDVTIAMIDKFVIDIMNA
uniref:L-histidine carboxy-lyase (Histamine-forming) n=1 Tax=Candidatus Kentrum sp. DK TaxID=2126562 RepID=A0A450T205_9GAMM|nr:MAG: L-histidine carboxy-lyase (histamine-forming) [Candidatus Kentron sp. DK]